MQEKEKWPKFDTDVSVTAVKVPDKGKADVLLRFKTCEGADWILHIQPGESNRERLKEISDFFEWGPCRKTHDVHVAGTIKGPESFKIFGTEIRQASEEFNGTKFILRQLIVHSKEKGDLEIALEARQRGKDDPIITVLIRTQLNRVYADEVEDFKAPGNDAALRLRRKGE